MTKIQRNRQDFEEINRLHGCLPYSATDVEMANRYQLAQAAKAIRLYKEGRLNDLFKSRETQCVRVSAPAKGTA